jgi:DNA-binding NarL/FixJ family response regulator
MPRTPTVTATRPVLDTARPDTSISTEMTTCAQSGPPDPRSTSQRDGLLCAGGVGYLLQDRVADVDSFPAALEDVVAGGTVLDAQVVAQLFARRRADDPVRRLTAREREVLGLIVEGHSNTAIARTLVVTPGAVEKHTQHIFAKLGLSQDEDQHRRVLATLAYLRR